MCERKKRRRRGKIYVETAETKIKRVRGNDGGRRETLHIYSV